MEPSQPSGLVSLSAIATNTILIIRLQYNIVSSLRPALREVVHVVVQLAGAGVAAGVRAALAAVLHQEAVPALDTCQLGTRHVSRVTCHGSLVTWIPE